MSNTTSEPDTTNGTADLLQGKEVLRSRLEASLAFRSMHRPKAQKPQRIPAVDFPDETSENYFHPRRRGLYCDAPLGLKY